MKKANPLQCAFQFLTRFPAGNASMERAGDIARGAPWFFFAAACVGAASSAVCAVLALTGIPYLPALGWVILETVLTGALHVDGFADVCDAFFSASTPERCRQIMKDSRLGTFGVAGLIFLFAAKVLLIGAGAISAEYLIKLITLPVCGKAALFCTALVSRPADRTGSGAAFLGALSGRRGAVSLFLCSGTVLALAGPAGGAIASAGAAVLGFAAAKVSEKKAGGTTGDVLGAANELGEVFCAFVLTSLSRGGYGWN